MGNISRLWPTGIAPGEPNDATQVADELDNIITNGVNENDGRITAAELELDNLTPRVTTNESNIVTNSSNIALNSARITSLEAGSTYGYAEVTGTTYNITPGSDHVLAFTNAGNVTVTIDAIGGFTNGEKFTLHAGSTPDRYVRITNSALIGPGPFNASRSLLPFEVATLTVIQDKTGSTKWDLQVSARRWGSDFNQRSLYVHNTDYEMAWHENSDNCQVAVCRVDTSTADYNLILPQLSSKRMGDTMLLELTSTYGTSSYSVRSSVGGSVIVAQSGIGTTKCIAYVSPYSSDWEVMAVETS